MRRLLEALGPEQRSHQRPPAERRRRLLSAGLPQPEERAVRGALLAPAWGTQKQANKKRETSPRAVFVSLCLSRAHTKKYSGHSRKSKSRVCLFCLTAQRSENQRSPDSMLPPEIPTNGMVSTMVSFGGAKWISQPSTVANRASAWRGSPRNLKHQLNRRTRQAV